MTKARTDHPDTSPELSEAARAVVRDTGDPRIDAHLRALGLAPDSDEPAPPPPLKEPRAEVVDTTPLTRRIGELESALDASSRRVRQLAVALVAALVALVALAAVLVVRP